MQKPAHIRLFPRLKKTERVLLIASFIAIVWGFSAAYLSMRPNHPPSHVHPVITEILVQKADPNVALSLVVEPDDGTAPVISMIAGAKRSVDLVIYTLNDKQIENALAKAVSRGVSTRVLLNAGYGNVPSKTDVTTFGYLKANGVSVKWTPAYFALTHQKTLVIDGSKQLTTTTGSSASLTAGSSAKLTAGAAPPAVAGGTALIMTFNLDRTYYKKDRDFGVVDRDPSDVAAIENAFDADWAAKKSTAENADDLVWSPDSEGDLVSLIGSAKTSLRVYNEEMNDDSVEDALAAAARRGVDVEVLMTMQTGWVPAFSALKASGVHVRTFGAKASLYIHAKMVLVDAASVPAVAGTLAFLGSENFSDASLDDNRELGIILSEKEIVSSLDQVFRSDWSKARDF